VLADNLWLIAKQNTAFRGQLGLEERRSITATAKADKLQSDYAALAVCSLEIFNIYCYTDIEQL
jgi:hypothetical protein